MLKNIFEEHILSLLFIVYKLYICSYINLFFKNIQLWQHLHVLNVAEHPFYQHLLQSLLLQMFILSTALLADVLLERFLNSSLRLLLLIA